jgi:RND superfamily putative drug exporter
MFAAVGRAVVGHPWRVIAAWVVAAVVVLAFSPQLVNFTSNNNANFLPHSYESIKAQDAANKDFPTTAGGTGSLVVHRTDGAVLSSNDTSKIGGLVTSLSNDHIPGVTSVSTSAQGLSQNKKVQLVQVAFKGQAGDSAVNSAVTTVRNDSNVFLNGSGLTSGLTGNAAISVDSTAAYNTAEQIIAIATVVLILLLLGLVFRSPIIALLPIVIIGVAHQMAQSLTADLAKAFNFQVGSELAPLLVVVMFGVGTDYIVFLLFRYRERLAQGEEPRSGLRFSVNVVGKVIASAAATVMAAFAALLLASLESLKTLAPGLIVGVLVMLAAAVTLVPAVFSLLGINLFWPSRPKPAASEKPTRSERAAGAVARRPGIVLLAYGAVLLTISVGVLGFKPTYNQLAGLPSSTPSQQAYNVMASAFPAGALGPTQVLATSTAPLDQSSLKNLSTKLSQTTGVASVLPAQLTADKTGASVSVLLKDDPYSTAALNNVEGPVRTTAHGSIPGAQVVVGGTTSQLVDVRTALGRDMSVVFPVAIAVIALILALLLRAVVAPLYLLVGVGLAYLATIGATVLVFISGTGYTGIDYSIPVVVYLFVVAIGTDYNILMASRLKEEFDTGKPSHEAARVAVVHGAPAVTAAGLILAGTFASLLLTGIQSLEEIGFGVAIGVVIAANVLSTRLVPAMASKQGHRFWWPHKRQRQTGPSTGGAIQLSPIDVPTTQGTDPNGSPAPVQPTDVERR